MGKPPLSGESRGILKQVDVEKWKKRDLFLFHKMVLVLRLRGKKRPTGKGGKERATKRKMEAGVHQAGRCGGGRKRARESRKA